DVECDGRSGIGTRRGRAELKPREADDFEVARHSCVNDQIAAIRLELACVVQDAGRIDGKRSAGDVEYAAVGDCRAGDRTDASRVEFAQSLDIEIAAIDRGTLEIQHR